MPVRTVLQLGNPKLRAAAQPIRHPESAEIKDLIADLADTLRHWRTTTGYGRAIAARQPAMGAPLPRLNSE